MAARGGLRSSYGRLFARTPRWLAAMLGVACVVVGGVLTFRPFDSLGALVGMVAAALVLTGVAELASARGERAGRFTLAAAAALVALGVVVAVWPGLTLSTIALLAGLALLVGGLLRLMAALLGRADDRLLGVVGGLARAIFGVVALSWPDATLLVVALVVGPATVIFGFGQIMAAVRRPRGDDERDTERPTRFPRWLRLAGAGASLALALVLLLVSALVNRSSASPDAFYDAPSSPPTDPGQLVRSEPFSRGLPEGARAWRILYTTTRADDDAALASAIVLVPAAAADAPLPVIAWAHGTTGSARKCAPSLLPDPFRAGAMPALDRVVAEGWALVATDYVGLGTAGGHPYLIGAPAARSVLDAVRAARQLTDARLGAQTVVWGHSQGGGAALWTGILATRYAPDAGVIGVAALSPATQLPTIFDAVKDSPVGKIMGSYVVSAYASFYPDVRADDYLRPQARVLARETAERCLSGPEALVSVATAAGPDSYFQQSPAVGALGARLAENVPTGPIEAPLLIGQGLADALVLPAEQQRYVDGLCANGQQVDYRTYEGYDHVSVVLAPDSPLVPDLVRWTEQRFAGEPAPDGCTTAGAP